MVIFLQGIEYKRRYMNASLADENRPPCAAIYDANVFDVLFSLRLYKKDLDALFYFKTLKVLKSFNWWNYLVFLVQDISDYICDRGPQNRNL